MARLNEAAAPSGNVNLVLFKQRWAATNKANEEFARVNAQQAVRIRSLECENSRLLEENLSLHQKMIHMQVQLDERDRSHTFADSIAITQKKLQEKMAEVNELLNELEMPKKRARRSTTQTPALESRLMRDSYVPGEMPPGMLPSISEDARSRRNSIQSESRRRSSTDFNDIQFPPQQPQLFTDLGISDNDSDDAEDILEPRRPRRRRDSSAVSDLEPRKQPARQKFVEQDPSPEPSPPSVEDELDFKFSKVAQRTTSNVRRHLDLDNMHILKLEEPQDAPMVEDIVMEDAPDERVPSPTQEKQERRHSRSGSQRSISSGNTAAVRKALGPKNANSDFACSPVKLGLKDEKPLSTPLLDEKAFKPTPVRSIRDKDTPSLDTDPASTITTTGRAARRARAQVSYAEPSLRAKMRREDAKLVDAVTGEGRSRRTGSTSLTGTTPSSAGAPTPDPSARKLSAATPTPLFNIKSEPRDEEDEEHAWLKLPMLPSDKLQNPQEGSMNPSASSTESSEQLPSSVITHRADRKRRTSGLVTDVLGSAGQDDDASSVTRPTSLRRTSLSNALDAARTEAREAREARERQRKLEREAREREHELEREREREKQSEERPDSDGSSGTSTTSARSEERVREKREREEAARVRIEERRKAHRRTTIHVAADGEGEAGKENIARKVAKSRSAGTSLERAASTRDRSGAENDTAKTTAAERIATRRRSMVV